MARSYAAIKKAATPRRPPHPVLCPICDKWVSRKNDLKRHVQTHNKDKSSYPFACPEPNCKFRSLQESNLKTHFKTHTGTKDLICPHPKCLFATSDPGSLTRHRKRKHDYVPRPRRKWCEETGAFEECDGSATVSPSTSRASSERPLATSAPSPFRIAPQPTPSPPPRSEPMYTYAPITVGSSPTFIARPVLEAPPSDLNTVPRAVVGLTRGGDTNIRLPSISTWFPDDDPIVPYGDQPRYVPSSAPCPGCPDCARDYRMASPRYPYPTTTATTSSFPPY
ncbi:hypothetical protein PQX77_005713 [Marasmius sp. AFHP31]|nr:hypothetical protein PQX77_005713 [Marasmius sp. AFHP31]